jgi:hypothetical protein
VRRSANCKSMRQIKTVITLREKKTTATAIDTANAIVTTDTF